METGNVQPKFGMMEMIFVSLRNQGGNPGLSVNLGGVAVEMFRILWGCFSSIKKSEGVMRLFQYEAVFTCLH